MLTTINLFNNISLRKDNNTMIINKEQFTICFLTLEFCMGLF